MKSPVFISNLTGKLEKMRAVSVNTLTNPFCIKMHKSIKEIICTHCYSFYFLEGFRKNAAAALQRNSELLSKRVLDKKELPTIKDKVFRFNAHGEMINKKHLQNYVNITEINPDCMFSLYSKNKKLIIDYFDSGLKKPSNLILVYSNPKLDNIKFKSPRWFDKVFNNVSENKFVKHQNCTGQKCKDCLICYKKDAVNVIVESVRYRKQKVKKYG